MRFFYGFLFYVDAFQLVLCFELVFNEKTCFTSRFQIGLISGLAVTLALGDVYKDVDIEYVEVIPPAVLTVLLAGLTYAISTGGEGGVNGFVRKNLGNRWINVFCLARDATI